jgi:ferric enterobactin receptor
LSYRIEAIFLFFLKNQLIVKNILYVETMEKIKYILMIIVASICLTISLKAQDTPSVLNQKFVLNGELKDEFNNALQGATVQIVESGFATTTNKNGYFKFELKQGIYTLKISFVGFYGHTQKVNLTEGDQLLKITLIEAINELQELEVSDQAKDKNTNSTQQGTNRMTISSIKKLPTLLGEVDIIRSLQTLPGVTSVGEGATGFNVRGGNIDQNLVLMDDIPIFNSSHLLGFYSVFNPDAVREMTLFRGGIPAQFGGRTASVLDIKLKEPDWDSFRLSGGVGILASRLMLETPIKKEKISLLIAGRASYTDLLFPLLNNESIKKTKASYYDITTKVRYKINPKNTLYVTGYYSKDVFKIAGDSLTGLEVNATSTLFRWNTEGVSLRLNTLLSEKLISNTSLIYSHYTPKMELTDESFASRLSSSIYHNQVKSDFKYFKNKNIVFNFGFSGVLTRLQPGQLTPTNEQSAVNPVILTKENSLETSLYFDNEWIINPKLTLTTGLRYAIYGLLAPNRVYQYEAGLPRDISNITDTLFTKGVSKWYHGPEPRLAFKYSINDASSIKLGYQRMQQFIQLVSNTTAALPTARWKMSDTYIKPQVVDQASIGYFQNFKNDAIETSVEFYYKNAANFPDYRSGVNLLLLDAAETAILQGKSRSYGVEVYLRKKKGRTTGWLTYTYSRSQILVNSPYPEDKSFTGKYYPTNFDKPHVLNLILNYHFNRYVNFAANFTYSTGRPVTFAKDKYYVDDLYVPNFINRNLNRIPDYHRLDLSMNINLNKNVLSRVESSLNFSIYNAYAWKNAYSIFFKTKNNRVFQVLNKAEAFRLAVIGTAIPSVTYNIKF